MKLTRNINLLILLLFSAITLNAVNLFSQDKTIKSGIGEIIMCDVVMPDQETFIGEGNKIFNHSNVDYYFMTYNNADWNIDKFVEEHINLTTGKRTSEAWSCSKDAPGILSHGDFTEGKWQIKFYTTSGKLLGESYVFEVKY